MPGREIEHSDSTIKILCAAERTDEALVAWQKGRKKGDFYFVIPRAAAYNTVRKNERFGGARLGEAGRAARIVGEDH